MILEHYSAKALERVKSTAQAGERARHWHAVGKPLGLWVSVKGDDDWPSWCNGNDYHPDRLIVRHEIVLAPNHNVLVIDDLLKFYEFGGLYGEISEPYPDAGWARSMIDWYRVACDYQGIIIAPYQWARRMDEGFHWYYSWDCASGCIWDANAISHTCVVEDKGAAYARALQE